MELRDFNPKHCCWTKFLPTPNGRNLSIVMPLPTQDKTIQKIWNKGGHTRSVVETHRTALFKTVQFLVQFKNVQLSSRTGHLDYSKKEQFVCGVCARVCCQNDFSSWSNLLRCYANCVKSLRKPHTCWKSDEYQAEPVFIRPDKLDWTLLSYADTRAVITEQMCTAQAEHCKYWACVAAFTSAPRERLEESVSVCNRLDTSVVTLGGLVVACLPLDLRFAGSKPTEDDGF
jgi:hypothetical protein